MSLFSDANALWTDEIKTVTIGVLGKKKKERKKKAAFDGNNTSPTVQRGGFNLVLWVCVTAGGAGNSAQTEGRTDFTKYQQVLEENVLQSDRKVRVR